MMWVAGVDPGETSGLVLCVVDGRDVVEVLSWAELDQKSTWLWLSNTTHKLSRRESAMICESFKPRGGRAYKFKPFSLELIGAARGLCWERGVPLILQDPAMKEKFHAAALELFPEVGRGGGGHARDALAHVIGWANTRTIVKAPPTATD